MSMNEERSDAQRRFRPPAAILAAIASTVLVILIFIGSRGFKDFDSALIGYAVATVVTTAALVYRYTLWVSRPPTWRYFKGGWVNFLSFRNFRRYLFLIPKALWTDIFAQTFIIKRGFKRWLAHILIFWGVILSLLITLPLTFGWLRFTLVPPDRYQAWVFGIRMFEFDIENWLGFMIYHGLDITAIMLIIGLGLALWRRTNDAGLLITQRFNFDLLPLVVLFAISVTGLLLTLSSLWLEGQYYGFISLTHQVVVVAWLLYLPFGKFFHIVQRPASIGVTLYQTVNQAVEHYGPRPQTGRCVRCQDELPSAQFIQDLEATLSDLGQNYKLAEKGVLQEYCPRCKRVMRGQAYYQLMGKKFL